MKPLIPQRIFKYYSLAMLALISLFTVIQISGMADVRIALGFHIGILAGIALMEAASSI